MGCLYFSDSTLMFTPARLAQLCSRVTPPPQVEYTRLNESVAIPLPTPGSVGVLKLGFLKLNKPPPSGGEFSQSYKTRVVVNGVFY